MATKKIGLLIHIGYPKTGSSWIQRFLSKNSDAGFRPLFGSNANMRMAIMKFFILPNALVFDPVACFKHFYPAAIEVKNNGLVPILSHERLAGTPHSGGYDSKELVNRLAGVFPEEKVLIVIREQKSMIVSSYKQYVRNGGTCSLWGYLYPPRFDGRVPLFNFEYFEYHRLIRHYLNLFGSSNVLVLPYELLKENQKKFISKIVRFTGAQPKTKMIEDSFYARKENVALSGFSIFIKRRLNHVVARRDSLNPHVRFSISRRQELLLEHLLERFGSAVPKSFEKALDERLKLAFSSAVGERYKESNSLVTEMVGLDLEKYGYDLP